MNKELENILRLKHRAGLPNVLIAAAECSPLSKTGGLADVAGALPKSLMQLGFDARVITPYHRCIKERWAGRVKHVCDFEISLGWRRQYVGLERMELFGLVIYLIDNEFYFGDKIYKGGLAEGEQYAFFQRAVLECIPRLDFRPEVLHCNDWHTAFIPFLIKSQYEGRMQGELKTVLTIHNIAFQGKFDLGFVQDLLGVDSRWYTPGCIEHYGCVNFLKAGCVFADKVNTVSPSYAREILTPQFGEGLQDVLASRGSDLSGIINGLDTETFDPDADPALDCDLSDGPDEFKLRCKQELINELGLQCSAATPVISMVTRITAQKGFDLVQLGLDELMKKDLCFVILGTGDPHYESMLRAAEARYKGRLCAYISYNEELAHRVYAGSDMLLMPSAFEPCGLSQMIAMRYGCLPVVHEVGGLRDSVVPYNEFSGRGNGFSFAKYDQGDMLAAVDRALSAYSRPDVWKSLRTQAMATDFSFGPSALEYGKLFISVLDVSDCRIEHRPFDEDFRCPLGALRCGETVRLRIKVSGGADAAELIAGDSVVPMEPAGDGFEVSFTAPDTPTVIWYGFRLYDLEGQGEDKVYCGVSPRYQMTVYARDFETPAWAEGAVMYQIFPDRYCRRGRSVSAGVKYHRALGREIELHESWNEQPKWQGGEKYLPNDFFGGTLSGIESRLPQLKELGVDVIYLNPIFESDSNHRYNTADYRRIDPILGSEKDLSSLCSKARELGMHIILDGVFSHTGDDSVYFNKYGRYREPGAYQSRESEYFSWYDFRSFPDDYRCWWRFKSLPEVNESDPGWQDFVISNEDSVIKHWLRAGAGGYRLDVADELPDGTLESMRRSMKETDPESLMIGEVWEDATTKLSYGRKRRYALGSALDSVMNYPLKNALIDFFTGKTDAPALCSFLVGQKLNYPQPMYRCLMNLLSSHDTARLRTVLGCGHDGSSMTREQQAAFTLSPEEDALGRARQRLIAAMQFTLPGMPCIYYGDEEGMQGFRDPFCRGPYVQQDSQLRSYYSALARLRHESSALSRGEAAFCAPDSDLIAMLRFDEYEGYLVIVNRSSRKLVFCSDAADFLGVSRRLLEDLPDLQAMTVPPMEVVIKKL